MKYAVPLQPVLLLILSLFLEYHPSHYPIFSEEISTHFSRSSLLLPLLEVITHYHCLPPPYIRSVLLLKCYTHFAFVCLFSFTCLLLPLQCKFLMVRRVFFISVSPKSSIIVAII